MLLLATLWRAPAADSGDGDGDVVKVAARGWGAPGRKGLLLRRLASMGKLLQLRLQDEAALLQQVVTVVVAASEGEALRV